MAFQAISAGIVYDGRILVEPSEEGSKLTLRDEEGNHINQRMA
jgi:hypothetical protein